MVDTTKPHRPMNHILLQWQAQRNKSASINYENYRDQPVQNGNKQNFYLKKAIISILKNRIVQSKNGIFDLKTFSYFSTLQKQSYIFRKCVAG